MDQLHKTTNIIPILNMQCSKYLDMEMTGIHLCFAWTTDLKMRFTMKSRMTILALMFVASLMIVSSSQAGIASKVFQHGSQALGLKSGYDDTKDGTANAEREAAIQAGSAIGVIGYSVGSAAVSGAGGLSGYAGMAAAVSQLGLGSLTTVAAGAMGSSATGAAATSLVVSAVGGPVVMGVLVVGAVGATGYGVYKGGEMLYKLCNE